MARVKPYLDVRGQHRNGADIHEAPCYERDDLDT